ncbi:RagB/SusD family nutrient uptake outer membrane protein [Parabacteroides acidifaciens]|uniref:RagB/SusD family nutrient uptake outer membrane protein n=1 Tax=Parabacteroides acidifaciens TaxID=2290935 RepID=A0A3D8HH04_9BACT|nr:RagB/SusD family nutrient uptake outer membrane protein [Parabacteroides acidifaciens]MBC8601370.1 RagB/SusD family nutrient uptake outer membrane protein [Parabacteroides acidifaciens]RDU49867.1 RagB/SusD family nutrient uptake outer membrane protein [Parabacteroides acidifaciens]
MKRKWFYYNIVVIICMLFCGCSDMLEEHPKAIASETFYNTEDEITSALNGVYEPIHGSKFTSYFTLLEACPDNVYGKGSLASISEYKGFSSANITNMGSVWTALYLSIRNANVVIDNVPDAIVPEDKKNQFLGEAKFLRAFDYFNLVRLWAGVPIRTEENMDVIEIPRSSQDDVYDLILEDLEWAETYLPDKPRLLGTPSKWTAKTLLADVYLNIKEWEKARDKAKEVIDSEAYSLVEVKSSDDFENIYGADLLTSSEEIFYFKYTDQKGWELMNFFHITGDGYKPYGNNWYSFYTYMDNPFYTEWDDLDLRKQHLFYAWDIGLGDNTLLFKKYIDPNGTSGASNDWPIYRYPELLLIYAEAANEVNGGPTSEAMECLNKVRRRGYGYAPGTPSPVDLNAGNYNKNSFSELVLRERGYEMILECKRWLDLLRTGLAGEYIKKGKGVDLNMSMSLWPIPVVETNYNKAIDPVKDQNPGY